jgi:hypothetical protein
MFMYSADRILRENVYAVELQYGIQRVLGSYGSAGEA